MPVYRMLLIDIFRESQPKSTGIKLISAHSNNSCQWHIAEEGVWWLQLVSVDVYSAYVVVHESVVCTMIHACEFRDMHAIASCIQPSYYSSTASVGHMVIDFLCQKSIAIARHSWSLWFVANYSYTAATAAYSTVKSLLFDGTCIHQYRSILEILFWSAYTLMIGVVHDMQ